MGTGVRSTHSFHSFFSNEGARHLMKKRFFFGNIASTPASVSQNEGTGYTVTLAASAVLFFSSPALYGL
jgi:hypothetical protein